ncbi:PLP-dependent aminotransferase family protein [Novosphingobium profundi]|uniref:aminotransferase-like domain-containing protein n=1 Tax=Novosphingobium profundi TaxID=1774954 RepID=UPI001BD9ACFE|nr:PLP-dependent aminotransferase family protein [Novosphingobium profundi]MBT0670233.1 PLP-dependent aminotransferase family protein [Novosphingobium profundi]
MPKGPASKLERVIQMVRQEIDNGALHPGDRLRSIREQAQVLGVSKNTVVEAYLRLVAQGVLQSRPGAGYFVARALKIPVRAARSPFAGIPDGAALLIEQLERRLAIRPGDGRLPADWLADAALRRSLSSLKLHSAEAYNYNTARGFPPLRERISRLLAERGIGCAPEQIVMTHGANHALDLIIRNYVRAGDAVLVEEPGYYPLFSKLRLAGARIFSVPREHDGPDPEFFAQQAMASGARLFFTQTLAHNPTGGSTSLARCHALLRIAEAQDMLIIEDDPFADILPAMAPRLAALDQLDRVIYVGSFSKTLAGSFRSGYLAANRSRADALSELLVVTMVSTSSHNERLIHALMEQGDYMKHLKRLSRRVEEAGVRLVRELEKLGLTIERPQTLSTYVWVRGHFTMTDHERIADAARHGIFIAPGSAFFVKEPPYQAMRINIAYGTDPAFLKWLGMAIKVG